MIQNLKILCFVFLTSFHSWSQSEFINQTSIADCNGAVSIVRPISYQLEFTGNTGYYFDLAAYPRLTDFEEKNSIWAEFTAPFTGEFSLNAISPESQIQLIVFKTFTADPCKELEKGMAEIQRLIRFADSLGLSKKTRKNYLNVIELMQGETIYLYFNTQEELKSKLNLEIRFDPKVDEEEIKSMKKVVDQTLDPTLKKIQIYLRDAETGFPIQGQLVITENRFLNAMYRGSEFIFDINAYSKISVNVFAEGYFFAERNEKIYPENNFEMVIWMEPMSPGKQVEIKGIEFNMGSAEFRNGAEIQLRKLRDFLLLNYNTRIEIQGHVHEIGEGSVLGKRLSYARAKRVLEYLVENGIDRTRLEAVGYGNEHMKFPEAKTTIEEQANRRVEIKIL